MSAISLHIVLRVPRPLPRLYERVVLPRSASNRLTSSHFYLLTHFGGCGVGTLPTYLPTYLTLAPCRFCSRFAIRCIGVQSSGLLQPLGNTHLPTVHIFS